VLDATLTGLPLSLSGLDHCALHRYTSFHSGRADAMGQHWFGLSVCRGKTS